MQRRFREKIEKKRCYIVTERMKEQTGREKGGMKVKRIGLETKLAAGFDAKFIHMIDDATNFARNAQNDIRAFGYSVFM